MLLSVAFTLWVLHSQIVLSLMTPLGALAHVQSQKAKAIANAINLHAKAKYNAALRKSRVHRAKLGDSRVIRDSGQPPTGGDMFPHPDAIAFSDEEDFDDRLRPENVLQSGEEFDVDERIGESPPMRFQKKQQFLDEPTRLRIPFDGEQINQHQMPATTGVSRAEAALGTTEQFQNNVDHNDERLGAPFLFKHLFHKENNVIAHDKTPSVNINIHTGAAPNMIPGTTVVHDRQPTPGIIHHTSMQSQPTVAHETTIQTEPSMVHHTTLQPQQPPPFVHHSNMEPLPSVEIHTTIPPHPPTGHHPDMLPNHPMIQNGVLTVDTRPGINDVHTTHKMDHFYENSIGFHDHPRSISHYFRKEWVHEHPSRFINDGFSHNNDFLGQPMQQPCCGFLGDPNTLDSLGDHGQQFQDDDRVGTFNLLDSNIKSPDLPEYYDPYEPQNKQPIVEYLDKEQKTFNSLMKFVRELSEKLKKHKPFSLSDLKNIKSEKPAKPTEPMEPLEPMESWYGYERNNNDEGNSRAAEANGMDVAKQQKALEEYFQIEQSNIENNLLTLQQQHQDNLDMLMDALHLSPPEPINLLGESQAKDENHRFGDLLSFDDDRQTWKKFSEQNQGMEEEPDQILGNLFTVPSNQYYEYLRRARSLNRTAHVDLEKVIAEEKDIINKIKKHAKHDEDLMMVGYIGESLIKDIEERRNMSKRSKRDISQDQVRRLFTDPDSKLDMPRTLENLGAVARSTFEHETTPMYHVRNLVGSAKDAVVAAMKIPNQNFITPSKYEIVDAMNDRLGDINRAALSQTVEDEMTKTFQRVGSAVRESVKSGQEAVNHIGELAEHGKKAINTLHYTTPRLILPEKPETRAADRLQKAVLVVPHIFEVTNEDEQLASTGPSEPDYVKLGNVFDAIGVSDPNTEVDFRRIAIDSNIPSVFADTDDTDDRISDGAVGSTLDSLQTAQISVGAINLRDFFEIIKKEIREVVREEILNGALRENKRKEHKYAKTSMGSIRETELPTKKSTSPAKSEQYNYKADITQPQTKDNETVGSFIPEYLQHPFMNQATPEQIKRFSEEHNTRSVSRHPIVGAVSGIASGDGQESDPIVGAINPMMFQRLFDEALQITEHANSAHDTNKAHDFFSQSFAKADAERVDQHDQKVSTSMFLSKEMLKPFMGQATKQNIKDFFEKYKPKDKDGKKKKKGGDKFEEIIFEPVDSYDMTY